MRYLLSISSVLCAVLFPSPGWTASLDVPVTRQGAAGNKSITSRILTQVELKQAGDEALIKIIGDGPLSYRVLSLGSDRVIVDLINTSTKLQRGFDFNHRIVRQIRIGQHPNLLRLVIDLNQPATYSIQEGNKDLSVSLAPKPSTRAGEIALPSQGTNSTEVKRSEAAKVSAASGSALVASGDRPLPAIDADRTNSEPIPHEGRRRAADRHFVDQPTTQPKTETYVAAFGGVSFSQSFTNVHGAGTNSSVNVSDLALARTGIGGLKAGFSPSYAKWMAIETEVFYASPHFKQQSVTVTGSGGSATGDFAGSHTRVATWALNWIVRYPGEWIQPYAGAGFGVFWGRLADSGGTSSSDVSPGLNALAGIRAKLGQHFVFFTEYKYNRTSFDFSAADFHVAYQAHYVVGGLGFQF